MGMVEVKHTHLSSSDEHHQPIHDHHSLREGYLQWNHGYRGLKVTLDVTTIIVDV